ncbi:ArsR/SmtB family transcription factor [Alkalihalobacillus sp. 1P02AB]|uniref:ArsR/SmtB family transcription factor n=1 Tax=Alkalihalobacillus sp. 1P02AB TaxID=3132260 RepID=UPI0039A7173A
MSEKDTHSIDDVTNCLKLMSDPTRLLIVKLVERRTYCVCQLVDMLEMSQPAISQHLRKLKQAGLINEERRGQWRFYSLNKSSLHFPLIKDVIGRIRSDNEELKRALSKERPVEC